MTHVIEVVNVIAPPVVRLTEAGDTDIWLMVTVCDPPVIVISAEAPLTVPLSEALTKRPTVPALLPAVKITEEPLPVTAPIAPLVRVQA